MTLLEKCRKLESDIASYQSLKRDATLLDRFSEVEKLLDDALSQLKPVSDAIALFHAKGLSTEEVPLDGLGRVQAWLAGAKSDCEKTPSSIMKRESLNGLRSLSRLIGDADHASRNVWTQYASKYVTGIGSIPAVLSMFPQFRTVVTKMRSLQEKIESDAKSPPTSEEEWDDFHTAVGELQGLLDKLNTSSDVKKFLSAISTTGASLDLLDAEVLQWLSSNNLKGFFRVVIKQA